MTRLAILVLAVGTLAGCDRHARPSDQSADEVVAKQKDVNADTATTHRKAAELDHAAAAFNLRREVRLMGLHSEYSMIAPQANMIESLSAQLPFTDDARKDIDARSTRSSSGPARRRPRSPSSMARRRPTGATATTPPTRR